MRNENFPGYGETSEREIRDLQQTQFRIDIKRILRSVSSPQSTLPQKERVLQLLKECLTVVPPINDNGERLEDLEIKIRSGSRLSAEEARWMDEHDNK